MFYTKKEDKFLRENYLTIPTKRMSKMLGRSESSARQRMVLLGIIVPPEIIQKFKDESRFKKGESPVNKGKKQTEFMTTAGIDASKATRFKKGQLPHNAVGFKNGDISIRQCHPSTGGKSYKWVRINLGKWQLLHIHIWEKKNGKLPKGHCLWFIDEDSMNCTLQNLELITRAENMKRNTIHNYPKELVQVTQLRGALNRQINKHLKKITA